MSPQKHQDTRLIQKAIEAFEQAIAYADAFEAINAPTNAFIVGSQIAEEAKKSSFSARAKMSMLSSFGFNSEGIKAVQIATCLHYHWILNTLPNTHKEDEIKFKENGHEIKLLQPSKGQESLKAMQNLGIDMDTASWGIARPACNEQLLLAKDFLQKYLQFSTIPAPERPLILAPFFLSFVFANPHTPPPIGFGIEKMATPRNNLPHHLIALLGFSVHLTQELLRISENRADYSEKKALKTLEVFEQQGIVNAHMERVTLHFATQSNAQDDTEKGSGSFKRL